MKKLLVMSIFTVLLFADTAQFTLKIPIDIEPIKAGVKGTLYGREIETNGKIYLSCSVTGEDGTNMNKRVEIEAGTYTYDMKISLSNNANPNKINHYSCSISCGVDNNTPVGVGLFFEDSDFSQKNYQVSGNID